ncbi:enoyl-CoA hydratase [Actinomadura sp. NBRC 104412]|nr:enoyl-CoA hydratase [Actinomadura sp. NBRC 104412]
MSSPHTITRLDAGVLTLTFDRQSELNALTDEMYRAVDDACELADSSDEVRVLVLRGAGDRAFASGTEISRFEGFTGEDGVEYEAGITRTVHRLESVRVPSVAVVRGFCLGGGLALAAACDLRIATPCARFGVPIARTLGNCLSPDTQALLLHHFGPARCLDMLLNARMLSGTEAEAAGFVRLVDETDVEAEVERTTGRLLGHAPLTMWAAKEVQRRLRHSNVPDGRDIIATVYGSRDFQAGVEAFLAGTRPRWTGG